MSSNIGTIAQERSIFALEKIQSMKPDQRASFSKLVLGLPAMILQNGFGHALAFLLAKGTKDGRMQNSDKHILAYNIITEWLCERKVLASSNPLESIKEVSTMSQDQYLQAQEESLRVLEWVKRYANADLFSG